MDRRDFLTLWLQALILALCPWMRTERGAAVARQAAQDWLADNVFVLRPGIPAHGNVFADWPSLYAELSATAGSKTVVIDDGVAGVFVPAGAYDLTDTTLVSGGDGQLLVPASEEIALSFGR